MAVSQAVLDAAAKRVATGASTVNTAVQGTTATPVSFGSTLNKTVTTPAAAAPLNFNPSGTIPKTSVGGQVKFGLPGISNPSSTGSSVGPGATVAPGSPYVPGGPAAKSTTYVPPGQSGSVSVKSTTVTPIEWVDNTPQNTAAFTSGAVSSAASAGGTESAVGAGRLADGTWDPNHIPSSEAEAFQSGVDAYTRKRWLANYYKSKNIPFNPENFDPNFDREAEKLFKEQEVEKSLLDTQINQQTTKAQNAARANQAASDVQLTSSREGVQSLSNEATRSAISNEINTGLAQLQTDLETKKYRLAQLQKGQEQQYLAGREDQIRAQLQAVAEAEKSLEDAKNKEQSNTLSFLDLLQKDNGLANLDAESLAYLKAGLPGVPSGILEALSGAATRNLQTDENKQKFTSTITALNTFKGLVSDGIQITPQVMASVAQQTGLPMESIYTFNQQAQQIMQDKTLDTATKAANLQKLGYDLDRQARGITNSELEKVDYIANLYRSGVSRAEINRAKNILGIKDMDDPMYRAEVEYKTAQAKIEQDQAKGIYNSPSDVLALASAQEKLAELGGLPSAVIPGKTGKYKIAKTDDGIYINAAVGTIGGQCGKFVNDVFGTRIVGDSYEQKLSLTDPSVKVPTPGMAFVQPVNGAYAKNGHIGMVLQVDAQRGRMLVIDSNAKGDQKINQYWMPISSASGFIVPPKAQFLGVGMGGNGTGIQAKTYNDFYTQLVEGGADISTPKKLEKVQQKALDLAAEEIKKDSTPDLDIYDTILRNVMIGRPPATINAESARLGKYLQKDNTKDAIQLIKSAVLSSMDPTVRKEYTGLKTTLSEINKMNDRFLELQAKGVETGPVPAGKQYAAQVTGQIGNSDLNELQKQIDATIQTYTKAMSGAQFSDRERAAYMKLFPSIYNSTEKNLQDAAELERIFQQKQNDIWYGATGGQFDSEQSLDDSLNNQTMANEASNSSSNSNNGNFYTNYLNNIFNGYDKY